MASTLSPTQSEFSSVDELFERPTGRGSIHALPDGMIRAADLKRKRPSLGKRAARWLARFLIMFFIGVAATLAWQSYGDAAKEMIANSYPQLSWLAPQAAAPDMVASAAPATSSPDLQQLKEMSLGLAAVRQSVDHLAAQLAAGQQQMAGDIAKLQAEIAAPQPRPAAPPVRKPQSLPSPQAPLPSPQAR
jgi:hypothetical protein